MAALSAIVDLATAEQTASWFIESLSETCQRERLQEKWLICPSLRAGHQWLEQVTRRGIPVVNLHVKTLSRLALDLCELARGEAALLSSQGSVIVMDRLISRLRHAGASYLSKLRPGAGLSQAFAESVSALRLAGVMENELVPERFEHADKAVELRKLLAAYRTEVEAQDQLDHASALSAATEAVKLNPSLLPAGLVVMIPEDLPLARLEQALLDALPVGTCRTLPVDQPGSVDAAARLSDAGRLRYLHSPTEAPPPAGDGTTDVFRAVGEVNEVREVLRRVLADGLRLDEVEVLHTDAGTYVPLLFELFARLFPDQPEAMPVTFAEGIPVRYSRPGRALSLWLRWMQENYPQDLLVRMFQEGLLDIPQDNGKPFSLSRLASFLRSVPIGFGRDRYLKWIDARLAALASPPPPDREGDDTATTSGARKAAIEAERTALQVLRKLIESLLTMAPSSQADALAILKAADQFLEKHARAVNPLDANARLMLMQQIRDMSSCIGQDAEPVSLDMRAWLGELASDCRVLGQGPRPGCLHVANVLSGGHTGRPRLFIVGLDDSRFPGAGLQDPVLLDAERKRLSSELSTAARRPRDKLDRFARLLAAQRAAVTLSFSCSHLLDDREMFPSPVVLAACRILSGNMDGDQAELLDWLGAPASFAPNRPEACLDETEWWLWRLCGPEVVAGASHLVGQCFPHLAQGFEAAQRRVETAFTSFDGFVPEADPEHDPLASDGPVMSSRRLEMLGRCPRAYFFQYLLKLEPAQDLTLDPTRWLDPLAFGSLLHEVFEKYFAEMVQGQLPEFSRDWPRLTVILDERIDDYRDRFPPPHEHVFREQCRELQQAIRIFLLEEETHGKDGKSRPVFLEAAVGMPNPGRGTALDSLEPVTIDLPGSQKMRVRALMDRLDQFLAETGPTFGLWDYKTGSTRRYNPADPFRQGRIVQNALYIAVAEARLRQAVSPRARVAQFGFFFPSSRGRGRRIVWKAQDLVGAGEVLLDLCRLAGSGAFLATNDHETDCNFCQYRPICGNVEDVARASQTKLNDPANTVLQPLLRLRTES